MRVDIEALDRASDQFLTAAFDPTRWTSIIEEVSRASGSYGVNIVPIAGRFFHTVITTDSLKPLMERYFSEEWDQRDFRMHQLSRLQREGMVLEQDYANEETFKGLDYYRSQAELGMRWTAILGFSSGEDLTAFVLQRRIADGPFDREEAAVFQKMRQKLMISAQMMRGISESQVNGMAAAFEIANTGCIFFNRNGEVTKVNSRAQKLLGPDLQISHGELRPAKSEEAATFNRKLKAVLAGGALVAKGHDGTVVLTRTDKRPLVVRIQRLAGDIQDVFAHSCAVAVIEDAEDRSEQTPDMLTKLFALTPVEAEVAMLFAQGLATQQIASRRQIGYETVRSHLKSIYRKTDTNRQSELSALLAKMRMG